MSSEWIAFFAGAPIWFSLGALAFAGLLAGIDRLRDRDETERTEQLRVDRETPDVIDLADYRRTHPPPHEQQGA